MLLALIQKQTGIINEQQIMQKLLLLHPQLLLPLLLFMLQAKLILSLALRTLRRALRPGAIACSGFYVTRNDGPRDDDARVKQLLKQTDKARQHAQERVPHAGTFMMGVVPKQWLEVLDEKHRYGSILYPYWQRWETSRTRMSFFMWLDEGRGCLVDLPDCPRRFLDECEVLYLTRDELRLFEVEIRDELAAERTRLTTPEGHAEIQGECPWQIYAIAEAAEEKLYPDVRSHVPLRTLEDNLESLFPHHKHRKRGAT